MDCTYVEQRGKDLVLGGVRFFDLAQTLDNGQAFRWRACDGGFVGIAHKRLVEIFGRGGDGYDYVIKNMTVEEFNKIFAEYFGLNQDYKALRELFFEYGGEALRSAMEFSPGLRLMRQDVWEVLVSFILSQNANIPRIKKMVEVLCECFGEKIPCGAAVGERHNEAAQSGVVGYAFPAPQVLAALDISDLAPVRAGYRAAYILDAARQVACGGFDIASLAVAPTDEVYSALLKIHGVGPKVADCVLLYGFGRTERYPTDVWIKRAMAKFYPHGFSEEAKPHAGVVQQFLFHYIRNMNL